MESGNLFISLSFSIRYDGKESCFLFGTDIALRFIEDRIRE
jgi:hypothetical protein